MNVRLKKTIASLAVVATAGLGLAACGGDDSSSGSEKTSTDSVGKEADTELTQDNFFTELAKAQQEAGSSHVDMAFGVSGQEIEATGDVVVGESAEDTAMQMKMTMGSMGQIEMRLVDNVMYMNLGPASDNKFAKIDLSDKDNPLGQQYGGLLDNIDPSKQLETVQDAVTGFEQKGGAEEIDGVEATPYVVTVDPKKITEGLEGMSGGAQVPDAITYTMFVGPDNLPRRVVTDVAGTKMTMNYTKWGEDVSVEAPAKDEISDLDMSQLGASMS